ncbi:leucine-rich repeat protein [Tanacetum coccineum]
MQSPNNHPRTLRYRQFKNKNVIVLIDGGSTHNFIDQATVTMYDLPILQGQKFHVTLANQEKIECVSRSCPIVLGVQWLETLGPITMDYKQLTMSFELAGLDAFLICGSSSINHHRSRKKAISAYCSNTQWGDQQHHLKSGAARDLKKGSNHVREVHEKQSMSKSRQCFWELAGDEVIRDNQVVVVVVVGETGSRKTTQLTQYLLPMVVGISCGKRHKRVIALRLVSQGLEGSLSPHVGNLSFLRVLSLGNNSFQGTIPHELGRLSRLRGLYLSLNKFSGVIPTNLSGCSNLDVLLLIRNKLAGSIPKEMSLLSKLSWLAIDENKLTGGIPPFLGNITSMEVFSVPVTVWWEHPDNIWVYGKLVGFGLCLPSQIGLLEMGGNNLTGKVTIDFSKLRDISFIALDNNNLHEHGEVDDVRFVDSLKNCTRLVVLELLNCNFIGVLPISIGLQSNRLKGKIPITIGKLQKLQSLELGSNQFSGPIPDAIGNLSMLTHLYLYSNNLEDHIPSSLGNCKELNGLNLAHNRLSGKIPKKLLQLPSLTNFLQLSYNNMSGSIPSQINDLKLLTGLDLSYNNLSGTITSSLGEKFRALAEILGLMRSDGIEIQRCYLDYLEALVSHYKAARSSRNPIGGYEGIRRFEDYHGDGNMGGSLAAKEKGRVEHFGITLKEEEEGKHKLMHTSYCQ